MEDDASGHSSRTRAGRLSVSASDAEPARILSVTKVMSQEKTAINGGISLPKWFIQGRQGWRRIVQNFTPSWYAVTMGTGIIPTILHVLGNIYPRYYDSLRILSIVFFVLNVVLFALISLVSVLRYALFPATWSLMINHPVQSLFLGCFPMGFATIINMFVNVCVPAWGGPTPYIAWGLWWFDAAVSVACCAALPFQMMTKHEHRHENMTAAWLIPIVSPIVAAASGGVVAGVLPNPNHALWTVITSYVLWGTGIPFALVCMAIYFHRLVIHGLPPREVIASVFLPLGPLGQGGFSVMTLGTVALDVFPKTNSLSPLAGEVLYILGFILALVFWGFGLIWGFFAVASVSRSRFPFNMGWWGTTFPTGVYAMSTLTMGIQLPSPFFKVIGTIFGVAVMLVWLIVVVGTLMRVFDGTIFEAPCLKELEKARKAQIEDERQHAPA